MSSVMLTGPSSAPHLRPYAFRPPPNPSTNPGALAAVYGGAAGQSSYAAGPARAIHSQFPNQIPTPRDLLNNVYRTPTSLGTGLSAQENNSLILDQAAGSGFIAPIAGYIQSDICICNSDHWFVGCALAWGHYSVASSSPTPTIRPSCTCPPGLPAGQIPKGCPMVANHLFGWVSLHHPKYAKKLAYRDLSIAAVVELFASQPI